MSKVPLRLYNRDIEALIDQGHYDEAVAHCKHLLKLYPKYLEAYRLLGKAYLEARRFAEAADIFQRVLLSVPDDFVSHLAMSIISDEQKDLDRAIWHMERAYEVYPSNAGVQNELRRLYGRRDGLEPPKIRLTRGALAQMYTKGGQYQQAITEIKAVLAEDPTRYDLRTLLARAYFRAGMKVEATEICTELLRQYPYHLDANRILVEILPGTSLAGSIEQYKKRVQSLDPYAAFVSGSLFEADNVPDNAVQVERLDYDTLSQESAWQAASEPAVAAPVPPSSENIPDWLQQAGWGPATGEFQESAMTFDEPEPSPGQGQVAELAQAEIPDWLKAMAPSAIAQPQDETPASDTEDLDWLAGLGAPLGESTSLTDSSVASSPSENWPNEWGQPAAASTLPAETDLNWLSELGGTPQAPSTSETPATKAETPEWLKGLEESAPAAEPSPWQTSAIPAEEPLPWETPPAPAAAAPSAPTASDDEDEALRWLESLAARQGAKPEELLTRPEERREQPPAWLADTGAPSTPPPAAEALPWETPAEPAAAEPLPWETSAPAAASTPSSAPAAPTASDEEDEALRWLESLAARQGAKPEELLTRPEERREQPPAWLADTGAPSAQRTAEALPWETPEEPAAAEPLPWETSAPAAASTPSSAPAAPTASDEEDEALRWLESLAARQG
ncbi:MAG: tetratricopeptide repeat protein, partial [Anaerolineales bacterium]|nr:tetratricopeptide repeat protein [Anaerolineales bacterium]